MFIFDLVTVIAGPSFALVVEMYDMTMAVDHHHQRTGGLQHRGYENSFFHQGPFHVAALGQVIDKRKESRHPGRVPMGNIAGRDVAGDRVPVGRRGLEVHFLACQHGINMVSNSVVSFFTKHFEQLRGMDIVAAVAKSSLISRVVEYVSPVGVHVGDEYWYVVGNERGAGFAFTPGLLRTPPLGDVNHSGTVRHIVAPAPRAPTLFRDAHRVSPCSVRTRRTTLIAVQVRKPAFDRTPGFVGFLRQRPVIGVDIHDRWMWKPFDSVTRRLRVRVCCSAG